MNEAHRHNLALLGARAAASEWALGVERGLRMLLRAGLPPAELSTLLWSTLQDAVREVEQGGPAAANDKPKLRLVGDDGT